MPLTVDLETLTPTDRPDFRVDVLERVGWLEEGASTAKWAKCWCPIPEYDEWLCHNAMYDAGIAKRAGLYPDVQDTMALAYSLGEQDLSLKGLGQKYLGVQTVTHSQQEKIGAEQYHAQDLWLTQRLWDKLKGMERGTAYGIDRALIPALIDCSYRGYEIDQDRLEQAIISAEATVDRAERSFTSVVKDASVLLSKRKKTTKAKGTEYIETFGPPGINSPIQLQRYFDVDSTSKEALIELSHGRDEDHALAAALIGQWRKSDKLLDTYFYPNRGKEKLTGLFNITPSEAGEGGTGTGRLSSERSNMQNLTPALERCLRAPEGSLLMRADYPQLELRCAAEISNDEYLIRAFQEGRDLHEETRVWLGLDSRTKAKNFNFGAGLYGGGADYVSRIVGRPRSQVAELMQKHRQLWTGWWNWTEEHWRTVQRTSYSVAPEPFLHKRYIPLLAGDHAKKAAVNHPVQSMAVYICKEAMVRLFQEGWVLVNQVHDSIHAYVPEEGNIDLLKQQFREIMESAAAKYLPRIGAAPVDVKVGRYWSQEES